MSHDQLTGLMDVHAHIGAEEFDTDRREVIERARANGMANRREVKVHARGPDEGNPTPSSDKGAGPEYRAWSGGVTPDCLRGGVWWKS